jgi:hypothetical protein
MAIGGAGVVAIGAASHLTLTRARPKGRAR